MYHHYFDPPRRGWPFGALRGIIWMRIWGILQPRRILHAPPGDINVHGGTLLGKPRTRALLFGPECSAYRATVDPHYLTEWMLLMVDPSLHLNILLKNALNYDFILR